MKMKKILIFLLAFILLFPALSLLSARADELWSEEYYRAIDLTGGLSDAQKESLDEDCIAFMKKYETDMVLIAVRTEDYENSSMSSLAWTFFDEYGFGYGEDRNGIIVIADPSIHAIEILTNGSADGYYTQKYLDYVVENAWEFEDKYGIYGILYYTEGLLENWYESIAEREAANAGEAESEAETETEALDPEVIAGVPAPEEFDPDTVTDGSELKKEAEAEAAGSETDKPFEYFHDENAPRVTDLADIFTDEEEKQMEERVGQIRAELNRDIAVVTDLNSAGKEHMGYATDFYETHGYGCGDDYEGAILFICMDPEDRDFTTACAGPETRALFTEEYANELDDALFEYMADGKYGEGVLDWIENFHTLYVKGSPFCPSWMPDDEASFVRFHNDGSVIIDDEASVFTNGQKDALEKKISDLSKQYGLDLVVATVKQNEGLSIEEYSEKFYKYNGCGYGDDYDGILLTIFAKNTPELYMYTSGKGTEKLSDVNKGRLLGFLGNKIDSYTFEPFDGVDRYIDQVGHMLKTGRVPRSNAYWIWIVIFSSIVGSIFGSAFLKRAKKKMETPALSVSAGEYLIPQSLQINGSDRYLRSSTHTNRGKYYVPPSSSSSTRSSSSSSRSSYTSSYRSSSGRSYSGSSRKF